MVLNRKNCPQGRSCLCFYCIKKKDCLDSCVVCEHTFFNRTVDCRNNPEFEYDLVKKWEFEDGLDKKLTTIRKKNISLGKMIDILWTEYLRDPKANLAFENQAHIIVTAEAKGKVMRFAVKCEDAQKDLIAILMEAAESVTAGFLEQLRSLMQFVENGARHTNDDLDKLALAWNLKPWQCDFCTKKFKTFAEAEQHEKKAHKSV